MRKTKLSMLVVVTVVMALSVTVYALAQCSNKPVAAAAGACAGGGCGLQAAGGGCGKVAAPPASAVHGPAPLQRIMTRALTQGSVSLNVAGCRGCNLHLRVVGRSNQLDANSSLSAEVHGSAGTRPVSFTRRVPGVFCGKADLTGARELAVRVSSLGSSEVVYFKLPTASCGKANCPCGAACQCGPNCSCTEKCGPDGKCPKMKAGACPMAKAGTCPKAAGCKTTADGKCSGMASGACATAGACKCLTCKCAPCKCK